MNAALRAVLQIGGPAFVICDITWKSRGGNLAPGRYGKAGTVLPGRPISGLVPVGGFKDIQYGPGVRGSTLSPTRTAIRIIDEQRLLARMVETYDPRGSTAKIRCGAISLVEDDWEQWFVGVVEDWQSTPGFLEVLLKTDDAFMRSPVPKHAFSKSDWTSADDQVWGKSTPAVFGHMSGFEITRRGFVPAINIRYDDTLGFWWCASITNGIVTHVYYDGDEKPLANFTIKRAVLGGTLMTVIQVAKANAPEHGQVVSFDFNGPNSAGQVGTTMNNPVRQLRVILEEYGLRDNRDGVWVGDHPRVDDASWDAVEAFFELHGYDCAKRIGGERDNPSLLDIVESFLDSYKYVRMFWTAEGTIAITIIDYADDDPPAERVKADVYCQAQKFEFGPGDRKEVVDRVKVDFLYSPAEQKYLASYEAHDLTLRLDPPVMLVVPNQWSHGRYKLGDVGTSPSHSNSPSTSGSASVSPSKSPSSSVSPSASPSPEPPPLPSSYWRMEE